MTIHKENNKKDGIICKSGNLQDNDPALMKAQMQFVLNKLNIGFHEWIIETNEYIWDENALSFWGLKKGTSINYEIFINGIHPDDREEVKIYLNNFITNKAENATITYRVTGFETGIERWLEVSSQLYFSKNKPNRLFGIIKDITKDKKNETKINDTHFRQVFESANVAKSITYLNGTINVNQAFCNMLGYTGEELINKTWKDLTPTEEIEPTQEILDRLIDGSKNDTRFIKRYTHKKGFFIWADVNTAIYRDTDKKPLYFITTIINITEQKRMEEKLRQSEERFSKAFMASPAGMIITRISDGKFIAANESFLDTFKYKPEEVIGHTSTDLNMWTAEERDKIVRLQLQTGGIYNFELNAKTNKGEIINLLLSSKMIEIEGENCLITTMLNVTDRKKTEDALQYHRKLLTEMGKAAKIGGWEFDPLTGEGTWTEEVALIHDLDTDLPTNVATGLSFYTETSRSKIEAAIKEAIEKNKSYDLELELISAKGVHKWVQTIGHPVINNGKVTKIYGSFQDITKRRLIEEKLKESEEMYRNLLEVAPVGIAVHCNGKIVFTNPAGLKLLGADYKEQLIGKSITEIIHPETKETSFNRINRMMAGEQGLYPAEDVYFRLDGSAIDVEVMASPLIYNGKPAIQVIVTDITERKKAEKQLYELKNELEKKVEERTAQLEAMNKELKAFSYSVSHDLKAPLRGIDGYSKLLLELYSQELSPEAQLFVNNIREGTSQMNRLIEDLLAYSRLERSQLKHSKIDLKNFMDSILHNYKEEIEERKVIIENNIGTCCIYADYNGLTIAVRNIIDNALKFTKNVLRPVLKIECKPSDRDVLISVSDNGIGFKMIYHDKIFEIFQRLQLAEDFPGTGIGLAMVQRAVQRMGGTVRAESQPEQGATFYIKLPVKENE